MSRILVTGATGNVGRLVVDELLDLGATDVHALTTNPTKAALPAGVTAHRGFIGRPETLPAALEGVELLYLAPWPDTVQRVVELAREAGVRKIVDFSSLQAEGESADDLLHAHFLRVEYAVQNSGLEWTHVRTGEYMSNFEAWFDRIRESGRMPMPYPEAGTSPIALRDVARAAATVLLEDGHHRQIHTVTGPELLRHREIARQIADAMGVAVEIEPQSVQEAIAEWGADYREVAEWYVGGLRDLVDHPYRPTSTYGELTGREGTTFAEWAAERVGSRPADPLPASPT